MSNQETTDGGSSGRSALWNDLGTLMRFAREWRGLSQTAAAGQTGVQPETIRRVEAATSNVGLGTLQRYLGGLDFCFELVLKDQTTGEELGRVSLPTAIEDAMGQRRRAE